MCDEPKNVSVRCASGVLGKLPADLICVPVFAGELPKDLGKFSAELEGALGRAWESGEITGKSDELFFTDTVDPNWQCRRLVLIGAGKRSDYGQEQARRIASVSGMVARDRHASQLVLLLRTTGEMSGMAQAVAEGVLLGAFRDSRFKTNSNSSPPFKTVDLFFEKKPNSTVTEAVNRGAILAECSNLARELSNEPGNIFTPRIFGDRASDLASGPRTTVEVYDEKAITLREMGLLLGVAQGSAEPPRVIVMRYEPEDVEEGPVLGLVGKGVTFDTGGISIKPAADMDQMKRDMAGGAAVVCAMRAVGLLSPRVRVIGIVPATENMPGGGAIRPGDVLRAANGKSVEVLNTDAEGRLILADGLTLAQRLGATHLVDIATLTGACVVALGHHASGLMGSPASWVDTVRRVATQSGERVWPLPTFEEYGKQLESETADLANIGGRSAGAITAGMFLKVFSGGLPWAHLDIAGTAWSENAGPDHSIGATGVGVRTLAALPFETKW